MYACPVCGAPGATGPGHTSSKDYLALCYYVPPPVITPPKYTSKIHYSQDTLSGVVGSICKRQVPQEGASAEEAAVTCLFCLRTLAKMKRDEAKAKESEAK